MKNFASLLLTDRWGQFCIRWKTALMENPMSKSKGFTDEAFIEESIAVFIDAVEEERKTQSIPRVAWSITQPWLVTFNGTVWHEFIGKRIGHGMTKH